MERTRSVSQARVGFSFSCGHTAGVCLHHSTHPPKRTSTHLNRCRCCCWRCRCRCCCSQWATASWLPWRPPCPEWRPWSGAAPPAAPRGPRHLVGWWCVLWCGVLRVLVRVVNERPTRRTETTHRREEDTTAFRVCSRQQVRQASEHLPSRHPQLRPAPPPPPFCSPSACARATTTARLWCLVACCCAAACTGRLLVKGLALLCRCCC